MPLFIIFSFMDHQIEIAKSIEDCVSNQKKMKIFTVIKKIKNLMIVIGRSTKDVKFVVFCLLSRKNLCKMSIIA
mgnify:CR=1 FL=1